MNLLEVRATFVPVPPYLDINTNPVDIFDKLTTNGYVWNTLLRAAKLNATVTRSEKVGECRWINNNCNCTGIFGQLFEGSIDFSLISLTHEHYDDKNLFTQLSIGAQVPLEQDHVFMSTAQEDERETDVSPFNICLQFPLTIVLLNFLALFMIVLTINFRLKKSRYLRIDMLDAIVLHTLRWSKNYKARHRRIIVYSVLLYCFFSHYFYAAQVRSDFIVVLPPKFLKSVEEVIKSNRTPSLFGGFNLKEELSHSKDENARMLLKRATERGTVYSGDTSDLTLLAQGIAYEKHVGLFETSSFGSRMFSLVCLPSLLQQDVSNSSNLPRMKMTRFGNTAHNGYFFPQFIRDDVKQRVEKAVSLLIESGQYLRFYTDIAAGVESIPNVIKEQLVYCLDNILRKKESSEQKAIFLKLRFLSFFINFACLAFIAAFICLVFENVRGKRSTK